MNANKRTLCMVTALMLLLATGPAWSAKRSETLSGVVTASPVGNEITVNSVTYPVVPSQDADGKLLSLKPGDTVDLILNAPSKQKGTQVISITVHPRQEN